MQRQGLAHRNVGVDRMAGTSAQYYSDVLNEAAEFVLSRSCNDMKYGPGCNHPACGYESDLAEDLRDLARRLRSTTRSA
jgi:hypothetical protein